MQITNRYAVWPEMVGSMGRILHFGIQKHWLRPMQFQPYRILDHYSIVYVLEGACTYKGPDVSPRQMRAGTAFALFPGVPHHYECTPGTLWSQFHFAFKGEIFDLWQKHALLTPRQFVFELRPLDYWFSRFEATMSAFPPDNGADLHGVCALQSLLADIVWHSGASLPSEDDLHWLQQAKAALEGVGRADRFDVEAIADQLNTSYANFRKKFTRLAKISPGRYHTSILMRRAAQVLLEEKITDGELSQRFGYADQFYFSQKFRKVIGMTPQQFRKAIDET